MKTAEFKNLEDYEKWLNNTYDLSILERYYTSVSLTMQKAFSGSKLWKNIIKNLGEYESEHLMLRGYRLIGNSETPTIITKPFKSFKEKLYRMGLKNSAEMPNKKDWTWIYNQIELMNDIIRTNIVVKYLDGVQYLINQIGNLCSEESTIYEVDLKAREEGYYAGHMNIVRQFEIPNIESRTMTISGKVEIQVTTQVQDLIRKLLHKHYEKRRLIFKKEEIDWQWNYKSNEFTTNYLGHILHYVEGMIVDLMAKKEEGGNLGK